MYPIRWLASLITAVKSSVQFSHNLTYWQNGKATEDEIAEYMEALGFEMDYIDEFHNDQYEVFDAVPNNVLYGIDKDLYFIDTQIRLKK